jgi:hypothetical protein
MGKNNGSVLDAGESLIYPGKPRVRAMIIKGESGRVYKCSVEEGTGRVLEGELIADIEDERVNLERLRMAGTVPQGSISAGERLADQMALEFYMRILARAVFIEVAMATEAFELFAMQDAGAIMAHWLADDNGVMRLHTIQGLSEGEALSLPAQGEADQVMDAWRGHEPEYGRGDIER